MKLVKNTTQKKYYHTRKCMVVNQHGDEYFIEAKEKDIQFYDLNECGHCKGVKKKQGNRSYYLTALETE